MEYHVGKQLGIANKILGLAIQKFPDDIDLVLLCTSTPEDLFGSAPQVRICVCAKVFFYKFKKKFFSRLLWG